MERFLEHARGVQWRARGALLLSVGLTGCASGRSLEEDPKPSSVPPRAQVHRPPQKDQVMNVLVTLKDSQMATLFDGNFTEFFVLTRDAKEEITTTEFYERRPDLGEIDHLKDVGWQETVFRGAELHLPVSGLLADWLKTFWITWKDPDAHPPQLEALALTQEQPIDLALANHEELIFPALMVSGARLLQFSWRPAGEAWDLVQHTFSGEMGKTGMVTSRNLGMQAYNPLTSIAVPVPGSDRAEGHVAWLDKHSGGLTIETAWVEGGKVRRSTRSNLVGDLSVLPAQRLDGLATPSGQFAVGFIGLDEESDVHVLIHRVDDTGSLGQTVKHALPQGLRVHGAAFRFYKRWDELDFVIVLLEEGGVLSMVESDLLERKVLRKDVALDYDFPLLVSAGAVYEVRPTATGALEAINLNQAPAIVP